MVKFDCSRLIVAIVVHLDLELFQMDVNTIFLSGCLKEEIYIDQPIGFISKNHRIRYAIIEVLHMVLSNLSDIGTRFHEDSTLFGSSTIS